MPEESIQIIIEKIEARKHNKIKDYLKRVEKGEVIQSIDLKDKEQEEKTQLRIKTNTMVDQLTGGIPAGRSCCLYGEFGSGKTQTVETCSCLAEGWVIYIDTEDSFTCERIEEICKSRGLDYEKVRNKIKYYRPKNWIEQMLLAENFPSPTDIDGKVDLIVCDSISKHFRGVEFLGMETLKLKNTLLREFIFCLEEASKLHKAALIYTTQIYDKMEGGYMKSKADTQALLGGHSVEHQPDFILHFRKASGNIRIVRMVDSSFKPLAEQTMVINEKGIDNLPPQAVASKSLEQRMGKFGERQHQEEILKEEKKKKGEVCDKCGLAPDVCVCGQAETE